VFFVGLIVLFVAGSAHTQHFVFVSDRSLRSFEAADDGLFYGLRHSPSRKHYAYINEQEDTWYVSFVNSEHGELGEQSFANPVLALEWLNDERVVLTIEEMDGTKLALLDFAGNAPYLINRNGHDFAARALGR
jgi:hypothetical protein